MSKTEILIILSRLGIEPTKPVWQLTAVEYLELLASILPAPVQPPAPVEREVYMTTNEVISYLNISRSTLSRWVKTQFIPCEKKGGVLRFRKSKVDVILNSQP